MQPQNPKDIAREAIREALTTYMRESGRVPTGIDFNLVETTCMEDISTKYNIGRLDIADREPTQTRTAQDCLREVEAELERKGLVVPKGPDVSPGIAWFNADGRRTDWLWIETEANAVQLVTPGAETGFVIIWPNVPLPATESHAWKHDGAELKVTYTRYPREDSGIPSLYGDIEAYYLPDPRTPPVVNPLSMLSIQRICELLHDVLHHYEIYPLELLEPSRSAYQTTNRSYWYYFDTVITARKGLIFKGFEELLDHLVPDCFHPRDSRTLKILVRNNEPKIPFYKRWFSEPEKFTRVRIEVELLKNPVNI